MASEQFLTAGEVAQLIGRSARTVSRLAKEGHLPYAQRTTAANGVYLFRRADVVAYLEQQATAREAAS